MPLLSLSITYCLLFIPISIVLLFFYKPRLAFILFFSTKFTIDLFWDHTLLGLNVSILQIQGILFVILCFLFFIRYKPDISDHPLNRIILFLFISNVIVSAWGLLNSHFVFFELIASPLSIIHVAEWNFRFINLIGALIFIPYIFNRKSDFRMLVTIFTLSTVIPVILGIIEYIDILNISPFSSDVNYTVKYFSRLTAGYHDSAVLAIVLFTGLSGSFYLFYSEAVYKFKWLYFLYFIVTLFLLYHTYSRTLWLTVVLFFLLFFLIQRKYTPVFFVILIVIISAISLSDVQKRFKQEISFFNQHASESLEIDRTGTGRIGLWKIAADHYSRIDIISKLIGTGGAYGSHNHYIAFLLKNGLIGLILMILFLYYVYRRINQNKNSLGYTIPPLQYALILSMFISSVCLTNLFIQIWDHVSFDYYFWGLCGMLILRPVEHG